MPEYIIDGEVIDNALMYGSHYMKGKKNDELVRCRDCKHYDALAGLCSVNYGGVYVSVLPSGYCAWGEREDA